MSWIFFCQISSQSIISGHVLVFSSAGRAIHIIIYCYRCITMNKVVYELCNSWSNRHFCWARKTIRYDTTRYNYFNVCSKAATL